MSSQPVVAFAPGRVNLIGEHTDYTGGLALPVALELGVTAAITVGGDRITLRSEGHETATFDPPAPPPAGLTPGWSRFVMAVAKRIGITSGFALDVTSTLPHGGTGLSSSSALSCAVTLALGAEGSPMELAQLARAAEIDATGVEIGIMDQAASMGGRAGHALLLDCHSLELTPVPVPDEIEVLVVHTGESRELAGSAYQQRVIECRRVEEVIGPLRDASLDAVGSLDDPVLVRRARHVITENERVRNMVAAFTADDAEAAGALLTAGHRSLSDDYEVSTSSVDRIVDAVASQPGVFGARLTGGGFGGSLVALCEPGTVIDVDTWWTRARPGPGARLLTP